MRLQAAGWRSLLLSTLLCTGALAKKDKPAVKSKKFDFLPQRVQYFDDSDVILLEDPVDRAVWRSANAGEDWDKVPDVPAGTIRGVSMHPYDPHRAYIITTETTHWKTDDRGETWVEFSTESTASIGTQNPMVYHAGDPNKIIFNAMDCSRLFCEEIAMYTTDGFATSAKLLRRDTVDCRWAKSSDLFATGQEDLDNDRILCVVRGRSSAWRKDNRLVVSDEYFREGQEFEPELEPSRTVQGVTDIAVVKKYLVVAASAEGTDEMALYISDDAIKWHRAVFPHDHKLEEAAFTVLEGTNYSIQIDILNSRPSTPMGVMLSSNSNGTYFTRNVEHTNRNEKGYVDFEKVSGIQGIFLVNTVKNFKAVEESRKDKELITQITFDDGRTFQSLTCDGEPLHLQSVTHLSNSGAVYSSPAPGLVMGIGNTGDYLKSYKDGNLYVSDDAGVTWRLGLEGPHKYEFGDSGSILVAVKDTKGVNEVKYSLNHGKDWATVDLEEKIQPVQLTTTKDSTTLKFLLEGVGGNLEDDVGYIIALDFDDLHERKCKDNDKDMEDWSARVNKDGEPTCLMGHTQTYRRRKADADCFIKNEFVDPVPISEPCTCTDTDFECDFNFIRSEDGTECKPSPGAPIVPEGACEAFGPDDTFKASSGWRLIPGNDCKRKKGEDYKDAPVDRKCSEAAKAPSSGKITHVQHPFPNIDNYVYLERTDVSTGEDETVILQTERNIFRSRDHGKTWQEIPELVDKKVLRVVVHPYFNDVVYFITSSTVVYYSVNRGMNIHSFNVPDPVTRDWETTRFMAFHSKHKDWIIWLGARDCDSAEGCHNVASLTTDRGDNNWQTLQRYATRCEFIAEPEAKILDSKAQALREKLIYCIVYKNEDKKSDNTKQLVSSTDFFFSTPEVHFDHVWNFATMSEYIVAARIDDETGELRAATSVDGQTFADAKFPHGFVVDHKRGYTVLDSSTHSVFLNVMVDDRKGLEHGTIIKSNSNGTSYALSVAAVDQSSRGFVDFEKMFGIEGLSMVNIVSNYASDQYEKEGKKLKTMITHNDGAEWGYLSPPDRDADGNKFDCKGGLETCALHIHGYTERRDQSHTFYSTSAVGLMFGNGNVGQYLTDMDEADTFMTADAGVTWKAAKKGKYMWEFGDQGSILVLVKEQKATNVVHYSKDEGDTWLDYQFSDHEVNIIDITTVPSDNSRNFLLWGLDDNGKSIAINLDFTGLTDVQCKLDENDVLAGDYDLWTPRHPNQDDDCLFGHVSQYHRKKKTSDCYNGRMIPRLHDIAQNCSCTRRDYECDYNFEPQIDGSCLLVQGLKPADHKAMCVADPDLKEYFEVTGYRKLSTSTCTGGKQYDVSVAHPCEGHREEFERKHKASGVGIFFAITIPILVAAGVGYWVWRHGVTKIGQIRLGEQPGEGEAPWIKYPVIAIAALVAIAQALPLLIGSLWRSASSAFGRGGSRTFTTRSSFARGRGDYAIVDEDEGELLGDESDEEV